MTTVPKFGVCALLAAVALSWLAVRPAQAGDNLYIKFNTPGLVNLVAGVDASGNTFGPCMPGSNSTECAFSVASGTAVVTVTLNSSHDYILKNEYCSVSNLKTFSADVPTSGSVTCTLILESDAATMTGLWTDDVRAGRGYALAGSSGRITGRIADYGADGGPTWQGLNLRQTARGAFVGTIETSMADVAGGGTTQAGALADIRVDLTGADSATMTVTPRDGSAATRRTLSRFALDDARAASATTGTPRTGFYAGQSNPDIRYYLQTGTSNAAVLTFFYDRRGLPSWALATGGMSASGDGLALNLPIRQPANGVAIQSAEAGLLALRSSANRIQLAAPWTAGLETLTQAQD